MRDDSVGRRLRRRWYWLLLLPAAATLWPGLYAFDEPRLGGIPFFYWYQFAWIILSAVVTGAVYLATRQETAE